MPSTPLRRTLLALAGALVLAPAAQASVTAPTTIDGPPPEIGRLGGVAQASDGTGGVTYLRAVDGRQHVFAAIFDGRRWSAPQRLDATLPFDSAWPRIAAGDGGRLVVVWAQHQAAGADVLLSAALGPGAQRFQAPTVIDFALGLDDATFPSVAMNAGGNALVTYRANPAPSLTDPLPSGFVRSTVRVARFDGQRWARIGVPVNRNPAQAHPTPTVLNAPAVALDANGNGVVAWQEPDDTFVSRVWARRVFGSRLGVVSAASPLTDAAGGPVRGGADQPTVADNPRGRIVVGYRALPDPRDRSATPQYAVNQMPFSTNAFEGPQPVGPAGDATPALSLSGDETRVALTRDGGVLTGDAPRLPGPFVSFDAGAALSAPAPALATGDAGRTVLAAAGEGGGGEVAISEFDALGLLRRVPVSTPSGGPIRELAVAGSGLGDALAAFAQGADNDRRIAVSVVNAPPATFTLELPEDWSKARRPRIAWTAATDALDQVVYTVTIDGRRVGTTRALDLVLREGVLDQGGHRVRVAATDTAGQTTIADPGAYRLDREPPRVSLAARGREVTVTVRDAGGSGVDGDATDISWGDGATSDSGTRTIRHRYKKRGRRTITVAVADQAGNRLAVRRSLALAG
jgi:hypothetical protein